MKGLNQNKMWLNQYAFLVLALASEVISSPVGQQCRKILIKNLLEHAFKASSSFEMVKSSLGARGLGADSAKDSQNVVFSPENIRQISDSDSAWCPNSKVHNRLSEFIEIDLQTVHIIEAIQIRGSNSLNRGMPYFQIQYKRYENETNWRIHQVDGSSENILAGIQTSRKINVVSLDPVVIARWIRIYPFSHEETSVCLTMEAYGCEFTNMIKDYKMHRGSRNLFKEVSFIDNQYDGVFDPNTNRISEGLGLLTDYRIPEQTDPLPSPEKPLAVNKFYVGWNKANLPDKTRPVDLIFNFNTFQKFESIHIYTVSNPKFSINLPKRISIKSSLDGLNYARINNHTTSSSEYNQSTNPYTLIQIDMKRTPAKFILISLEFATDWILLSEVYFLSEPTTIDLAQPTTTPELFEPAVKKEEKSLSQSQTPLSNRNPFNAKEFYQSNPSSIIVLIIVLLILFVMFLGCFAIFSCFYIHRRRVNKHRSQQEQKKNLIVQDNHQFPYQNTNGSSRSGSTMPTIDGKTGLPIQRRSCSTLNVKTDPDIDPSMNSFWFFLKMFFCGKLDKHSKHSGSSSSSHDPSTSISSNQNSSQNGNLQVVNGMVQIDFNSQNRAPTLFFPGTPMMPFNQPQITTNPNPYMNYSTLNPNYSSEQLLSLMNQMQQNNALLLQHQNNFNSDPQNVYSPINPDDEGNMSCEYASTGKMSEKNPRRNMDNGGQPPSPPPNHPNNIVRQMQYNQTLQPQHLNNIFLSGVPNRQLQQQLINNYYQMNGGTPHSNISYGTQKPFHHQNPG